MIRPHLALFDFDGTITSRDTMFAFVHHAKGPLRTGLGLLWLSPVLALHAIGLVGATTAKTALLRHFFGGTTRETLASWGETFTDEIEAMVRPRARARLAWHREQGHEIVLVSASLDIWLRPWATRHGYPVLCTEAAFEGDRCTGALATPNCNGAEKESRIRAMLDLKRYAHIYGYGDSSGDKQMLALANEIAYRPFRES